MNDYNRFIKRMTEVYPEEKRELEKKKEIEKKKEKLGGENV